jgi:hypothetical protein
VSYDEYFGRPDRDSWSLVRVKRDWLPDWAWWLASCLDPEGLWLCRWLSVEADQLSGLD